ALSGGNAVDLSGVPLAAIERVEILKDGASAIYGTDAIAGVINFILRKDFKGVELNGDYDVTEHPGGNSWRGNATFGFGDLSRDRYNVFVSADYLKQDSLKAIQRDFSRTGYLPSLGVDNTNPGTIPANIFLSHPGGYDVFNPSIPPDGANASSCLPPLSFPPVSLPSTCTFDAQRLVDTIPESERTNVIVRATWQVTATDQLFAESTYYRGRFVQRIAPAPVLSPLELGHDFTLPPSSPFYPAAFVASLPGGDPTQPLEILYRTLELGPRVDENHVDQWTAITGMQGTRNGWDYQWSANWVANEQKGSLVSGYADATQLAALLHSGVVNVFGFNTDDVVRQLRATQVTGPRDDNRASNYGADFKVSGNAFSLPAGPIAVAGGVEGRRESLEQSRADLIAQGNVLGFNGGIPSIPTAYRTVWAAFGEANIPLAKTLEADVAVRFDDYSDFGSTTNPKVSLRWQPSRNVLMRAAYGTGFRAPTLSELFQPSALAVQPGVDPIRCPVTQADRDCFAFFLTRQGGNPALSPEKSRQFSGGIVIEPTAGLSASVDYYDIEVRNLVQLFGPATIFANAELLPPSFIVRAPPDAQFPDLPGRVVQIVTIPTNLGQLRTSGLDADLRYRPAATSVGQFTFALSGTYVLDYRLTGANDTPFPGGAGQRGVSGAISRWRHYATLDWSFGAWGATLANNFQLGYSEPCILDVHGNSLDASGCMTRRVGSYSVWDFQVRYGGFANTTLTLGVRNLLDTAPPLTNQQDQFLVGFDPTYADARGRTYYAAIRCAFK
ncbi:MAG TPA: TonB-dependent receptor, partial [Casimicrobiaceae bacterium]